MAKKSFTRDEAFLIKLAELAAILGSKFHQIDCYKVGQAIGQNNRSVDNIVRMLAQTNFIKKGEGTQIYLTPHGEKLINQLFVTS